MKKLIALAMVILAFGCGNGGDGDGGGSIAKPTNFQRRFIECRAYTSGVCPYGRAIYELSWDDVAQADTYSITSKYYSIINGKKRDQGGGFGQYQISDTFWQESAEADCEGLWTHVAIDGNTVKAEWIEVYVCAHKASLVSGRAGPIILDAQDVLDYCSANPP